MPQKTAVAIIRDLRKSALARVATEKKLAMVAEGQAHRDLVRKVAERVPSYYENCMAEIRDAANKGRNSVSFFQAKYNRHHGQASEGDLLLMERISGKLQKDGFTTKTKTVSAPADEDAELYLVVSW